MATKPRVDVVLTPVARDFLKNDEAINAFIQNDSFFNCKSVEQIGSFLCMKIKFPKSMQTDKRLKDFVVDLWIPIQFVLYMVSGNVRKNLGFRSDQ